MLPNQPILYHPLFLFPSIVPSPTVFSSELALLIRWLKYWIFSFSISPSNEYSGLISFRIDLFDLLAVQGTLKSPQFQSIISLVLSPFLWSSSRILLNYWKNHSFIQSFVGKVMSLLFHILCWFVMAFLPRSKSLNFMAAVTIETDFGG